RYHSRGDGAFHGNPVIRATTEDDTDLEQPNVARHVREVVLDAARERLERAGSEQRLALRKRIENAHTVLARIRDEWNRAHLHHAGLDERTRHAARDDVCRRLRRGPDPERTQLVGEGIVATQARDFLDQIHLERDIGAPPWRRDAQHFVLAGVHSEADAAEQTHALWRGDMLAEDLRDARYAERQLMRRWASRTDRDRRAVDASAGKRYDECRGIARELGGCVRVECPLEAITRIGGCAERATRRAHRAR